MRRRKVAAASRAAAGPARLAGPTNIGYERDPIMMIPYWKWTLTTGALLAMGPTVLHAQAPTLPAPRGAATVQAPGAPTTAPAAAGFLPAGTPPAPPPRAWPGPP